MGTVASPTNPVFRFGLFELETASGELRKAGVTLHLRPQATRVLAVLARRPGELVTRDELRQEIWGRERFGDFDHGLNLCILQIREVLGDDAGSPRYIQTLPGRGYRFIAPVEQIDRAARIGLVPARTGRFLAVPLRRARTFALAGLCILALMAVMGALLALNLAGLRDRIFRTAPPTPTIQSIAVLPLENLSGDSEQEYFADGMTGALIADLGKISALRVISRTSAMHFKGARPKGEIREIARQLNVEAVVEGSVLRSGDRVQIRAQLIEAKSDRHLWAETYDRNLRDVLSLQSEVARAIAREVQVKLPPQEQARLASALPVNPEARELYLRGRYLWERRTEEGVRKSLEYYQQALKVDPDYAPAYAGMAMSYMVIANRSFDPPLETWPKVKENALKALELDEGLAEAHAAWSVYLYGYAHDWATNEKALLRAIELNPGYATAYYWHGECIAAFGRLNEALQQVRRGQELDPLSRPGNSSVGRILYLLRRYDDAILQFRKTIDLHPTHAPAHLGLGAVYMQKGLLNEALAEFRKAVELSDSAPYYVGVLGGAYAVAGKKGEALAMLRKLEDQSRQRYVSPHAFAEIYAGLGEKDRAIQLYEKSLEERSLWVGLPYFRVDPRFDSWRSDPRFQDLLRRMNFPP